MLGHRPVDALAGLDHLAAVVEEALDRAVDVEALRHRGDAPADLLQRLDRRRRSRRGADRPDPRARLQAGPAAVEPVGREAAESTTLESEQRFRLLFNIAPVGLCFVAKDGALINANARLERAFGYSRAEVRTLAEWWQLAYPDPEYRLHAQQTWKAGVLRARQNNTDIEPMEFRITCKNGEVRTVLISGTLIGEDFLAVFFDITERKRAEEALRYHQLLLQEVGRVAKIGGWELNPATGAGTWTEEVAGIHDLDPAEETNIEKGMSFYQGESRTRMERAVREAVELGKPYNLELEMVTAKGAHKWVQSIGNPVVEEGKVVHLRGSFQDITDRKRVEEALRETGDYLRNLVDYASAPIIVWDALFRITIFNAAFETPHRIKGR